jgi:Leucine-rich repeat (LRR) protein
VDGNLLQSEVPELKKLVYLKKLSLAGNQIAEMWPFPQTLELLNLAGNQLKKLSPSIFSSLCNLKMLDVSNNYLESLEGVENLVKLKRIICK